MIVYHVTTFKKLNKYLISGQINSPVRAWESIKHAERMSLSTGRKVILRLKFPDNTPKLEGHFNQARVSNKAIPFNNF